MIDRKFDIYFNEPFQSGSELAYLKEALDNNWLSTEGEQIRFFQQQLGEYLKVSSTQITLTNSGTSALHLALIVLGVEKNDHVICPAFSFVASSNPILYQGAVPVFVDSEKETWNMDPEYLQEAIEWCLKKGKKPKAVILVHTYGAAAKWEEISKICRGYGIPIIEDAAEALGSSYQSKLLGTYGDLSVLSFNGNKIVTTTSGGALISKEEQYINKANRIASQAKMDNVPYNHSGLGYNYRMSNVCAAIGRAQMQDLEDRVVKKRSNYQKYYAGLVQKESIEFQLECKGSVSNRWVTAILLTKDGINREIANALLENRIECRHLWKPIHLLPHFKKFRFFGSGFCHQLHQNGLALPSSLGLKDWQIKDIVDIIDQKIKKNG